MCDLILCSLCILEGTISVEIRDFSVYPLEINSDEKPLYISSVNEYQTSGISMACKIAAKVSLHTSYVNAVNKYLLSCEIHSTHWVDLNPSNGPIIPLSYLPFDYMRYGYAIVIAYSIVEELNLSVNASSKKPSLINGEWNPEVKRDLERRLIQSKIDIDEPIVWERRGSKKRLEKRRPIKLMNKLSWTYGNIRDCEIPIIDAINSISWLRSRIIAHKSDKDIKLLMVYDVSNAQQLAR